MQQTVMFQYWLDDGWFVGRLPSVPGVLSQGETLVELEENLREAYQIMLEEQDVPQLGTLDNS